MGGIEGGMTNGMPLLVRAVMKPIPTQRRPLRSVDIIGKKSLEAAYERSDTCAVPAAAVIGEAFSPDVLERTIEMRRITLLKNLSEIEKTHKLIHYLKNKYRFDHGKIREVLYNGISEALRREYHMIIGDTITEQYKENLPIDIINYRHKNYVVLHEMETYYLYRHDGKKS